MFLEMPYIPPEVIQKHIENVRNLTGNMKGGGMNGSNLGPITKGVPPGARGPSDKAAANAFPIYGPNKIKQ
jgi:hypothetical protein